jgi:Zn-dependent protease
LSDWRQERLRDAPSSQKWPISSTFLALVAAFLLCAVWMVYQPDHARRLVFPFVLIGFVISVCLHEFGHAIVAYRCGDWTVREKGYLTLDPLRYTDVQFSIVIPLLIMAFGGVGLPGGAVYITTSNLRRRIDSALVSAGGPLATGMILLILMAVLNVAPEMAKTAPILYAALAFLTLLQVTALLLNLLPCPGLDGWGIVEPFLPHKLRAFGARIAPYGPLVLLAALLLVPGFGRMFWWMIYTACGLIGFDTQAASRGFNLFRLW